MRIATLPCPTVQLLLNKITIISPLWWSTAIVLRQHLNLITGLQAFTQDRKGQDNYLYSSPRVPWGKRHYASKLKYQIMSTMGCQLTCQPPHLGQEKLVELVDRKPFYYTAHASLSRNTVYVLCYNCSSHVWTLCQVQVYRSAKVCWGRPSCKWVRGEVDAGHKQARQVSGLPPSRGALSPRRGRWHSVKNNLSVDWKCLVQTIAACKMF